MMGGEEEVGKRNLAGRIIYLLRDNELTVGEAKEKLEIALAAIKIFQEHQGLSENAIL